MSSRAALRTHHVEKGFDARADFLVTSFGLRNARFVEIGFNTRGDFSRARAQFLVAGLVQKWLVDREFSE